MNRVVNAMLMLLSPFGVLFGVFLTVRPRVFLSPEDSLCWNHPELCDLVGGTAFYLTSNITGSVILLIFFGLFVSSTIRFFLQSKPRSYDPDFMTRNSYLSDH